MDAKMKLTRVIVNMSPEIESNGENISAYKTSIIHFVKYFI
ncbi:unnamed protein product [Onchocerca flexuosa]|uniref:Dihydropteroate synthase n=1 Tax=Onchocerca flexuosa TaxID=387005 RepID=A0A183HD27_9BILA|nr:unnamed protein product [Onchocerca flexuosa]